MGQQSRDKSDGGRDVAGSPESAQSSRLGKASGTPKAEPEVPEKAQRRRYTAAYKLRILRKADACTQPGEIGALLRREGLYSSLLSTWRGQREKAELEGLEPKKRGRRQSVVPDARDEELERLRRENEQMKRGLDEARTIIEFQKKVSDILRLPLSRMPGNDGSES